MIPKPKSELTVMFISMTIMLAAFIGLLYYYLTVNQATLLNHFEQQRVIRADIVNVILNNITQTLQTHDDRLVKLLEKLNITTTDND